MILGHLKISRRLSFAGFIVLAASGLSQEARAQHTADPYNPYNQEYNSYIFSAPPIIPGSVPNQAVLEGRSNPRGMNRFDEFLQGADTFEAEDVFGRRRTGPGVSYRSVYRRYDRDFGRIYEPNASSNQSYYEDRQRRHELYMDYLRERNPKRRAQLYREYTQSNLRASRDLRTTRGRVSGARTSSPEGRSRPAADLPDSATSTPPASATSTAPAGASILSGSARSSRRFSTSRLSPSTGASRKRAPRASDLLRRSQETNRGDAGELPSTKPAGAGSTAIPR